MYPTTPRKSKIIEGLKVAGMLLATLIAIAVVAFSTYQYYDLKAQALSRQTGRHYTALDAMMVGKQTIILPKK